MSLSLLSMQTHTHILKQYVCYVIHQWLTMTKVVVVITFYSLGVYYSDQGSSAFAHVGLLRHDCGSASFAIKQKIRFLHVLHACHHLVRPAVQCSPPHVILFGCTRSDTQLLYVKVVGGAAFYGASANHFAVPIVTTTKFHTFLLPLNFV